MRLSEYKNVALMSLCLLFTAWATPAQAQVVRSFAARYNGNVNGDIRLIGNTMLTCDPTTSLDCAQVRLGQGNVATERNNNNAHAMIWTDVDSDSSTFNSSAATLALPANATVVWAGLYWGGRVQAGLLGRGAPTPASRNTVKLRAPGQAAYTSINAGTGCDESTGTFTDYQCFKDITTLVSAQPNGVFTVADLQVGTGQNRFGGWGLIVAYRDPSAPIRNIVVYDGYANVIRSESQTVKIDINIGGFLTPAQGDVITRVGALAYEGDLDATGDRFLLQGTPLSDASNPASNFFNASIANGGANVTTRNPAHVNQLGFDLDVMEVRNALSNMATTATITLETTGDTYFPGVVTFATDIYAPRVAAIKTVTDVNGESVRPGDVLEYRIVVENSGNDPAGRVVLSDPLPTGISFVPGSIRIDGVAATDQSGDDRAEYVGNSRTLTARLGTGANASQGGTLATNANSVVTFRVRVDEMAASGALISNQATVNYRAQTLAQDFNVLTKSDPNGVNSTPTTVVVTVTAPTIDITAPNANEAIADTRPAITGTANPGATVSVKIDGGAAITTQASATGDWVVVPSQPLAMGMHTVVATVTNDGRSATDQVTFSVDTTNPAITITSPTPGTPVNSAQPAISGTTEAGATVTVIVDGMQIGQTTADVQGNWTLMPTTPLADGPHAVLANARDAAGNTASAASSFIIDTTAPAITITEPTNGSIGASAGPAVTGSTEPNTLVRVSIDGSNPVEVTSDASGRWRLPIMGQLADGPHTVTAVAIDAAGNQGMTSSAFTIDTVSPSLTIIAPANGGAVASQTPTIRGKSEPGQRVDVTIDGGSPTPVTADAQGNWSLVPTTPLAEGPHTVTATARDAAGNTASDSTTFAVDLTAPIVTLDTPAPGSSTRDRQPVFAGTAEPGATVVVIVDGRTIGTTIATPQGTWSLVPAMPLAEGPHNVEVIGRDAAGNEGRTNGSFTIDTVGPTVRITEPADGSVSNDPSRVIVGASEPGAAVTVILDGVEVATVVADGQGRWSYAPTMPLTDGPHTVVAIGRDAAGNEATDSSTFVVDTQAPDLDIVTPASGDTTNNPRPTITGTAAPGASITVVVDDGAPITVVADGQGNWSYVPDADLGDGPHTVRATTEDAAGNVANDNTLFIVDTMPPVLTIVTPTDGGVADGPRPTITGTTEPGATVVITIDGVEVATVVADGNGVWTYVPGEALTPGAHTVTVTTSDPAGNTSTAMTTFEVPARPPLVVITPQPGDNVNNPPTVTGTGAPGATIIIVVDGEEVGRTVVGPDGMWSVTPNVPLPTGEQTITVIAQGEDGINEEVTVVVTVGDSDSTDMVLAGGCNAGGAAGPSGLAALWLLLPWGLARRKRRVS
jgi:large repetitive protein